MPVSMPRCARGAQAPAQGSLASTAGCRRPPAAASPGPRGASAVTAAPGAHSGGAGRGGPRGRVRAPAQHQPGPAGDRCPVRWHASRRPALGREAPASAGGMHGGACADTQRPPGRSCPSTSRSFRRWRSGSRRPCSARATTPRSRAARAAHGSCARANSCRKRAAVLVVRSREADERLHGGRCRHRARAWHAPHNAWRVL